MEATNQEAHSHQTPGAIFYPQITFLAKQKVCAQKDRKHVPVVDDGKNKHTLLERTTTAHWMEKELGHRKQRLPTYKRINNELGCLR